MALLVDKASEVNIEIIDNQVAAIIRHAAKSQQNLQDAINLILQLHQLVNRVTGVTSL
jgi:hypothetical protein